MTDKQKRGYLTEIVNEAELPREIQQELIAFINARPADKTVDYRAGAEAMRGAVIRYLLDQEDKLRGAQASLAWNIRQAVGNMRIPGCRQ